MNTEALLQTFPNKRIKPIDGMAVTAEVWEEAHTYHRHSQGMHTLFTHGPGIMTGLEVVASDPPDTSVYILPGVALDTQGQTIVLAQPVSYDIGDEMEGLLYLLISYSESRPKKADKSRNGEGAPVYVQTEFSIWAQTTLPNIPHVELARVQRSHRESVFVNPPNPATPDADEIDLRFRREVGAPPEASMAVCYLGQVADDKAGQGASYLAQALNHMGQHRVFVEDGAPIGPNIVTNTLVYLVGQGEFQLNSGIRNGLRNYVNRGQGVLLIESLDPAAETSFLNFLNAANMPPKPLPAGHRLLTQPHLFATPPPGYETDEQAKVLITDGVIFSTHQYGLLWQGERRDRLASREEIRSGVEWGGNIITYALDRRRVSGKR